MTVRNDLELYDRHAAEWWDERSPFSRSLHEVQRLRLRILTEWLGNELLRGTVADLGCGGGLIAEPLARLGPRVVGLDISANSIAVAEAHARENSKEGERPLYLRGDLRAIPAADGSFDGVLLADVVEHIESPDEVLAEAARVLRPGGWMFVSTIAQTRWARLLAVHLAEGIRLIPRGTHDPKMFISPAELDRFATAAGLCLEQRIGEVPDLLGTVRSRAIRLRPARSTAIAYSTLYRKEGSP